MLYLSSLSRFSLNDERPYELTTGVNVGLGYSFEETRKVYKPHSESVAKAPFGHLETSYNYGFTPFGGFSAIELSPENTRGVVETKYRAVAFTTGGLFSIGINSLDIGLAVGIDLPFGSDGRSWDYRYKPWIGAGIGIDLVK